jgi:hypothetical protein
MADELNKPSRGTGDWDIPVNDNFDTLEAAARAFLPRGTTQTLNVSDVNSDSITNSGQVTTQDLEVTGAATGVDDGPTQPTSEFLHAGRFSGSDIDTRLSNAIQASSVGDVIQMESGNYSVDQSIPRRRTLQGTSAGGRFGGTAIIDATYTFAEECLVQDIGLSGAASLEGNFGSGVIRHIQADRNDIIVSGGSVKIFGCSQIDVTLESTSSRCVVAVNSLTNVTDNGTNNISNLNT